MKTGTQKKKKKKNIYITGSERGGGVGWEKEENLSKKVSNIKHAGTLLYSLSFSFLSPVQQLMYDVHP